MRETLRTIYDKMKTTSLDSGLVQEVVLVKTAADIEKIIQDVQYRTLFVLLDSASIYTDEDDISFSLTVIDKCQYSDDSYLDSVNDGVTLIKTISDKMNYKLSEEVVIGDLSIGSEIIEDTLLVSVECNIDFLMEYLPDISGGI